MQQTTGQSAFLLIAVRVVRQENSRAISVASTNKSTQAPEKTQTLLDGTYLVILSSNPFLRFGYHGYLPDSGNILALKKWFFFPLKQELIRILLASKSKQLNALKKALL